MKTTIEINKNDGWAMVLGLISLHGGSTDTEWQRANEKFIQGRHHDSDQLVIGVQAVCKDGTTVSAGNLNETTIANVATQRGRQWDVPVTELRIYVKNSKTYNVYVKGCLVAQGLVPVEYRDKDSEEKSKLIRELAKVCRDVVALRGVLDIDEKTEVVFDFDNSKTVSIKHLINCTPHSIKLYSGDEAIAILPKSEYVVRVKTLPQEEIKNKMSDFPVVRLQELSDEVTGLPPSPYPPIVVSVFGAEKVSKMYPGTVFATDTGPDSVVRDFQGNILGIRRLQYVSPYADF